MASYAKLFLSFIEHQYQSPKPELYGRYIGDCIGANSSTREELSIPITRFLNTPGKFSTLLWLSRNQNFN